MDQVNIGLISNWTRGQEIVCPACGKDSRLCQHVQGNLPSALRRAAVDTVAANFHRGAVGSCDNGICVAGPAPGCRKMAAAPMQPSPVPQTMILVATPADSAKEKFGLDLSLLQQPVNASQVCGTCTTQYPFKSRQYGEYIDAITEKGFPYITNSQGRRCQLPPFVEARQCGESKNMMRRREYNDLTKQYIYARKTGLTPDIMPRPAGPPAQVSLTQRLDNYDLYGYGNDFTGASDVGKDISFDSPYRNVYISDKAVDKITGEKFGNGTVVDSTKPRWKYTTKFI